MRWNKLLRFILFMAFIFIALPLFAVHANVRDVRPQRPLPTNLSTLQLETPLQIQGAGNIVPFHNNERQSVIVQLQALPIARVVTTSRFSFAEQLNQRSKIYAEQQALIAHAESLDAELRVFGRVRNALNAVMLEIDTAVLPQLAANPDVVSIQPIVDYKIDLTDTAVIEPASITQNQTYDGSGISVAVLDSGIDYTHVDFGGSGNQNDYTNNNPFIVEPGSFPTNKIVGGYDFVGSRWLTSDFGRNSLLHADPDPLDLGIIAGHGTRIASILGGVNGIAPGVDLYAVRVCTSHTTLCSGIALIQGFDYLLDPNRDGYIDDAVDIVNLSIQAKQRSPFDLQVNEALENISRTGVLTVGSAGNGFNHPYGTGMPGASTSVLTVGATASASTPYIIDSANRGPLFLN
ncbi:MAG: S8 family serine peptidase, partial [Chloroflexi bacterium]|nr:S8 family serine peptidase [Chloroflexota bacterium]